MLKKVAIIGGGVGGMSAAQELLERNTDDVRYDVTIFEANAKIPGGKARSLPIAGTGIAGNRDLPAEHGFRFFPGFYRNLPDSMRKIPYQGQKDGVWGNMVETTRLLIGRSGYEPFIAISRFPKNFDDLFAAFGNVIDIIKTGLTYEDLLFFAGKFYQLFTTCDERREDEFEKICWWDFIEASSRSKAYQDFLAYGLSRSLAANDPKRASTKTLGNIYIQLLLGILLPGEAIDRVLNAPTNEAWIDPWKQYLESLGAKYVQGTVAKSISCKDAVVTSVLATHQDGSSEELNFDEYIFAVPVERMAELLENSPEVLQYAPDLEGVLTLQHDVAWMNGFIFYLNQEVNIVHGHQLFVDSPWSVTAVAHTQFWQGYPIEKCGNGKVKTVFSTDISNWNVPGVIYGKPACELDDEQIKEETWEQIKRSLNANGRVLLQDEMIEHWFLDEDISITSRKGGKIERANREPLLVNLINKQRLKPKAATQIHNMFLAADYVKTETDFACMEGANEAARIAVNSLLDKDNAKVSRCPVYGLEEPAFFKPMKENDKKRYKKGLPWNGLLF
ncbi:MAG: FAD-dependent oxidoreductase [Spirochaetota bacterium]